MAKNMKISREMTDERARHADILSHKPIFSPISTSGFRDNIVEWDSYMANHICDCGMSRECKNRTVDYIRTKFGAYNLAKWDRFPHIIIREYCGICKSKHKKIIFKSEEKVLQHVYAKLVRNYEEWKYLKIKKRNIKLIYAEMFTAR